MKESIIFISLFIFLETSYSQSSHLISTKPPIDTSEFGKWPTIKGVPIISKDGNYVAFGINNQPINNLTLVVKKADGSLVKEIVLKDLDFDNYFFSSDSKQIIWKTYDTLFFYSLITSNLRSISGIKTVKTPLMNKGQWVAYQLEINNELVLLNILSAQELRFNGVKEFEFDYKANSLMVSQELKKSQAISSQLLWAELDKGTSKVIWSSDNMSNAETNVGNFSMDIRGDQVSFIVQRKEKEKVSNSLWYAKRNDQSAIQIGNETPILENISLVITNSVPQFSKNGKWVFFKLQEVEQDLKTNAKEAKVIIWSYKDSVLQPEQARRKLNPKYFTAVVPSGGGEVIQLERKGELMYSMPSDLTSDYIILKNKSDLPYWWRHSSEPSYYLVSLKNGTRKMLKAGAYSLSGFTFSPKGQFLIYWDIQEKAFFSFNCITSKSCNISRTIPVPLINKIQRSFNSFPASLEPAGWSENDKAVLLYDNYDIWLVDLNGSTQAINITNGYGTKHNLKLRFLDEDVDHNNKKNIYSNKDTLLLTGFNINNKFNGFFKKILFEKKNPELLTLGPYTYYRTITQMGGPFYTFGSGMSPIKAENSNAWIVQRSSAKEAPNYFYTLDFKSFISLSDLKPQNKNNWITTQLITWKMFDGSISQGILYKPENFDPKKKYPIIFNYYEKLSHRLYEFPTPYYTSSNINIPWFVSNGYLVFTPDIHFKVASVSEKTVGEWAYNSVVSAARYLSKLPFIDAKKMALQGHSFGGLETAYLVTHCGLFAAASEVAGSTDPVSRYLTLAPFMAPFEHNSAQESIETSHELYGATPWERPDLYLKNSSVLSANKATTPLLIVHNPKDNQVQWRQGIELYMAMRRLGKKCWMLQYDESGHSMTKRDAIDYTIRLTQFFDHYLKGMPPPKWMSE
jgi:dipeptidyl aminopeptidase/acylaminoacyl peptidase